MRVEVLVPADRRDEIVSTAARLRGEHRASKARVDALCAEAMDRYRARILDNVDLDRLEKPAQRASVIARALMERGDANAFKLGRHILAELGAWT